MSVTVGAVTRYVSERELVYSPHVLGYPSISGCHAIAFLTEGGLFGYHSLGGETAASYRLRAAKFAEFRDNHPAGRTAGKAIYAACYLTAGPAGARGYGEPRRDNWLAELLTFAEKLDFGGPIYGYDLGSFPGIGRSAYVEIIRTGPTCVMQVRSWIDHEETKGTVDDPVNIRYLARDNAPITNRTGQTIVGVGNQPLKTVYPMKLR